MKKILCLFLFFGLILSLGAQEFKVVTIVESIVPMGMGRSRIIEHQSKMDVNNFTTERKDGTDSKQKEKERKKAKVKELSETKLLNFFSGVGINFQNIASNDALISSKINTMIKEGWNLTYVTSAVESAGKGDPNGIFITRLFFSRPEQIQKESPESTND